MEKTVKKIKTEIRKNGIFIENRELPEGTPLKEIAQEYDDNEKCVILAARNQKKVHEL